VLAQRVHRDVAHHDHLVVVGLERRADVAVGVVVNPGADLRVHAGDAGRRLLEAVAVRVLADGLEDLPHRLLDPWMVDLTQDRLHGERVVRFVRVRHVGGQTFDFDARHLVHRLRERNGVVDIEPEAVQAGIDFDVHLRLASLGNSSS